MIVERKWVLLQHVPFEGPGLIATIAAERGLQLTVCHSHEGDRLPRIEELEGLVVMGGPMSVRDNVEYPYLLAEAELIASALAEGLPVLGVCLGAQLMAHALGASVFAGAHQEIGVGTVTLSDEGLADEVLGAASQRELAVMHWHGETFELPAGAVLLAGSKLYANQAFRLGKRSYGFQFHLEADAQLAGQWRTHLPAGVDLKDRDIALMEGAARSILGAFFDAAAGPA